MNAWPRARGDYTRQPVCGRAKATNAWRVYEMASGRRADEEDRASADRCGHPAGTTTAIFSRTDGICAWQGCMEEDVGDLRKHRGRKQHCGMGHHPAVVYAVADRLAQPEGKWTPFDRSGGAA